MDARESAQRQHRVLGHFLAIQAWLRGLDCIVLVRDDLEVFLGLKHFKAIRVKWMLDDLKPWFPHQIAFYSSNSPSSLYDLFLSRVSIEPFFRDVNKTMTTKQRIASITSDGPRTERLSEYTSRFDARAPTESEIVRYLAVLDSGLEHPTVLRDIKRERS